MDTTNKSPQAPPITVELVEKQLSVFCDALFVARLHASDDPVAMLGSASNASINFNTNSTNNNNNVNITAKTSSHKSTSSTNKTSSNGTDEDSLQWHEFVTFIIVAALWLIENALSLSNLMSAYDIGLDELRAICGRFLLFDKFLAGEMLSEDLFYLLQVKFTWKCKITISMTLQLL